MSTNSHETDLIVIGGGLAGLTASLVVAENGGNVTLIEKTHQTGGSSAMSGGCLAFAGTDIQARLGIEDSSENLFSDLRKVGGFENDEELVRLYVTHQLQTYEWLKKHGVQFGEQVESSSGQSIPRSHNVDPADMVRALTLLAQDNRHIDLIYGARANQLLTTDDGLVAGVQYTHDGSNINLYASRGVVLCSGGFNMNRDLVHRYAPQYDHAVFIGGEGNVGDGLKMALKLGADTCDMTYIKGTFGKHPTDDMNHHSMLAVYKGAIAINQDGKRFVDESISYKLLGDATIKQPYGVAYQIFDDVILNRGDNRFRILDFQRRHELGLMYEANTLEDLARQIEVPPEQLVDTVTRYNSCIAQQYDPDFGRTSLVSGQGALIKIDKPPFYAYPSTVAVFGTYCGLKVNSQLQVLDVYGSPIRGLFAAGEVVGGLHGSAYMTGSALGKAAIFGKVVAMNCMDIHA